MCGLMLQDVIRVIVFNLSRLFILYRSMNYYINIVSMSIIVLLCFVGLLKWMCYFVKSFLAGCWDTHQWLGPIFD